jgi:hypothetical protein
MGRNEHMKEKEMKKLMVLGLAVLSLATFGLMVGCDNGTPGTGPGNQGGGVASIEIRVTHDLIRGFQGELRTETVTAIARDAQGVAVPFVNIDFGIQNLQSYMGTIAEPGGADSLTNQNGEIVATYTVVIQQSTPVVIEARHGSVNNRRTINIELVNDIVGSVSVSSQNDNLAVPPNQTRFTNVTAQVVDTAGNALSGMQVHFRVEPSGMGVVDSDTGTTDFSGSVTRKFTSIVGRYGTATVAATVGTTRGATAIDVRAVAAPAYITLQSPNATIKAATGTNAIVSLIAVVTDSNRVGVPGTTIEFRVLPVSEGGATFGALSAFDTTDANGRDSTTFNSLGSYGRVKIRATVVPTSNGDAIHGSGNAAGDISGKKGGRAAGADEEIFAEITVSIERLSNDIGSLTVRAFPSFLTLPPDSQGYAQIRAQVKDVNNVGIPNVTVNFVTDRGSLSKITPTDSTGLATADFRNNYEDGIAHITGDIPGTDFVGTTTIEVHQSDVLTGFLTVTTDKAEIFADFGLTTASITALLKDQDHQSLSGKQVKFTSTHGAINSPVTTDSLGRAIAVFSDVGLPSLDAEGNVIPAKIFAIYDALNLIDSCAVTIRPRNPVHEISLISAKAQMTAGSADSSAIRATAILANGAFAPAGTLVQFQVSQDNGSFSQQAVPVGNFGVAETQYIAGNIVGTARLQAFVVNDDDSTVYSNEVPIALLPGPPSTVRVTASPIELNTNDPGAFSTVRAAVTDTAGNQVGQGILVRFTTTMGDVTPSAITDSAGIAWGRLTPGVNSGVAEVTGTVTLATGQTVVGTATVTFIAGNPNVIELAADPLQIAVQGTGGITTSTLRATVRDANGNLIGGATKVVFTLINHPAPPAGCTFPNQSQIDSATTANGLAVISLSSGTQVGGVLIKAETWRDSARTNVVSVVLSTIAVVSGPPAQLDIDVNDDGDDAGGGTWEIPVSCRVFDLHRNPVADRIPVVFTVDPPIATIDPGFTGNDIGSGATPGLAYAWMRYHSQRTFSQITISAEVRAQNEQGSITGDREHILPLQDGVLDLNVDPQNWMFDRGAPRDTCLIRVWAILTDGHQILINNGPILFRTDRGDIWYRNWARNGQLTMFTPDNPAKRYTGVEANHEAPGQATVYLRGQMSDFYLDDFTLEVTVHIEANVEGYDVSADPEFIFMTRH